MWLKSRRVDKATSTDNLDVLPPLGSLQVLPSVLGKFSSPQISEEVDIHGSNIWDSTEMETLRKVFKSTKHENMKLRAILLTTHEELEKLKSKNKQLTSVVEIRTEHLNEATKANERMHIMCKSLKKELDISTAKVSFLHEENASLRESKSKFANETHKLQLHSDKERIERKKVELDLRNQQKDAMRDIETREEHLNILHENDIQYLRNKILEAKEELETEKQDHARTKRGLDHLRTHFANVPLSGDNPGHGAVVKDQLMKWTC